MSKDIRSKGKDSVPKARYAKARPGSAGSAANQAESRRDGTENAKVTSNGRITIPFRVRKGLGIEAGDLVEFFETCGGVYFVAAKIPVRRLKGLIPKPANPVSIEDMNAVTATSHYR